MFDFLVVHEDDGRKIVHERYYPQSPSRTNLACNQGKTTEWCVHDPWLLEGAEFCDDCFPEDEEDEEEHDDSEDECRIHPGSHHEEGGFVCEVTAAETWAGTD